MRKKNLSSPKRCSRQDVSLTVYKDFFRLLCIRTNRSSWSITGSVLAVARTPQSVAGSWSCFSLQNLSQSEKSRRETLSRSFPPLTWPQIEWKHTRSSLAHFFCGNYTQHLVPPPSSAAAAPPAEEEKEGKEKEMGFPDAALFFPFLPPPFPSP